MSAMSTVRTRGEEIRCFILQVIERHPADISRVISEYFGITRQAANKHLQRLVEEGALNVKGQTRNHSYVLAPLVEWRQFYEKKPGLAEDLVWANDVKDVLGKFPENVLDIWHFGFTEMFNNALDHSEGNALSVLIRRTAATSEMVIRDNGIGIFKKIQGVLNLPDERHAVFELAKGKLTTDPKQHSGEGIFFASRVFDSFDIFSGGVHFSHEFGTSEDWIMERDNPRAGTSVWLKLNNHTSRTLKRVFDKYASGDDDYGFTKTVVPLRLAQYGNDKLISRSQAKRVVSRIELFKTVIFDFRDVAMIGQAFADEIFRVFAKQHPEIHIVTASANTEVKRMIKRATTLPDTAMVDFPEEAMIR